MKGSRPPGHFARMYAANPDPWGFLTDPYEHTKYDESIKVLQGQRYVAGLEVGCSIGILTQRLAPMCVSLLGIDVVEAALTAAASRCAEQSWVRFQRMQIPQEWPEQRFDLIVLSEVLYFLSPTDIERCAERVSNSLLPDGAVLLVNWLGESDDPMTGDEAADHFIATTTTHLSVTYQTRKTRYRLDLLRGRVCCNG
jgi:cyclopropane fatty-acyl-phospholipid synthase-like methyltransferase